MLHQKSLRALFRAPLQLSFLHAEAAYTVSLVCVQVHIGNKCTEFFTLNLDYSNFIFLKLTRFKLSCTKNIKFLICEHFL